MTALARFIGATGMVVLAGGITVAAFAAPPVLPPLPRSVADAAADSAMREARDAGCGRDGGHDCALQAWMKQQAGPPSKSGDIDALAAAFDSIATFAPHTSAYPNWTSIAKDGAGVARRGRVDAARVACVSCHEQYRARFRRDLRELPLAAIADAGAIDGAKP